MNKYTVVLLLPDYVAGQYGETYCAHVKAADPKAAVEAAQHEVWKDFSDIGSWEDFLPVFVAAGHHNDLGVL